VSLWPPFRFSAYTAPAFGPLIEMPPEPLVMAVWM
jgi:hypothetical protein